MDLTNFAYLQAFFLRKKMENDTAGLDLEAGSLPAALDARLGRILMASEKKRPRGARDSGERSRAMAHLAPDLSTKSQKVGINPGSQGSNPTPVDRRGRNEPHGLASRSCLGRGAPSFVYTSRDLSKRDRKRGGFNHAQ
jgi:hypothetical protein